MNKLFKGMIIAGVIFIVLLLIGGYIAYINRAAIAGKAMNYAMQRITGSPEDGSQTWLGALIEGDSAQDVKNALIKSVLNREPEKKTDSSKRKPGLATMAEMLANGAGEDADLGKLAQAFLGGLSVDAEQEEATSYKKSEPENVNDINARDTKGRTLLMNVCRVDVSPKVIKMLLRYGADINAVDNKGRSALMYAVALNEDPDVVEMLLQNGADGRLKDNEGKKVIEYAKTPEMESLIKKYTKSGWFF